MPIQTQFPVTFFGSAQYNAALINLLTMPAAVGKTVTLEYVDASTRYVWTPNTTREYWTRWRLNVQATGFWSLRNFASYSVVAAIGLSDPSLTYSGTWVGPTSASPALTGYYRYSKVAGSYVELTFSGEHEIYAIISKQTNGGYGNVTINGGTELVNELPDAQLNCYATSSTWNSRVLLASDLDPGQSYTVRLTATGTKPPESAEARMYFEGFGFDADTVNDARVYDILYAAKALQILGYDSSAKEYALQYKPSGAINYEWTGSEHGNENITSVTWEDGDGNDISVSAGTPRNDTPVVAVEQSGTSRHSQTGATDHANVLCRHTFNIRGLTIYHRHDWLSAADVSFAYPAMLAARDEINRGHVAGDDGNIYSLDANDDTWHGQKRARVACIWRPGQQGVAWCYMDDLNGLNNYARSANYAFIEDRSPAGATNKIYFQRTGGDAGQANETIAPNDVWENTAYYRVSILDNPDTQIPP